MNAAPESPRHAEGSASHESLRQPSRGTAGEIGSEAGG